MRAGHEERPARLSPTAARRLDRPIHQPAAGYRRLDFAAHGLPASAWTVYPPTSGAPRTTASRLLVWTLPLQRRRPIFRDASEHAIPGTPASSSAYIHDESGLAIPVAAIVGCNKPKAHCTDAPVVQARCGLTTRS